MVNVFILLGGLIGLDGYAVSPGILLLAHRLEAWRARQTEAVADAPKDSA